MQLGVEVINPSTVGVTLLRADVNLPLGGLRVAAVAWGSCGEFPAVDGADPYSLWPGATTWLRMTFDVLIPCPDPIPVHFTVSYPQAGKVAVSDVGGFSESYTGCSARPG